MYTKKHSIASQRTARHGSPHPSATVAVDSNSSTAHPIPSQRSVCVFITNRGRQGMLPSSTVCLSSSSAAASHVDLSSPVRNKYTTLTTLKLLTSNCTTLATFFANREFSDKCYFFLNFQ